LLPVSSLKFVSPVLYVESQPLQKSSLKGNLFSPLKKINLLQCTKYECGNLPISLDL